MFYQPILLTDNYYSTRVDRMKPFDMHWHSDLELVHCRSGSFQLKVDAQEYHVQKGQVVFISSAVPHEYYTSTEDNEMAYLRVGSVFLGSALFSELAKKQPAHPIFDGTPALTAAFDTIAHLHNNTDSLENKLKMQSAIYLLLSLVLENMPASVASTKTNKRLKYVLNIQNALDYVSTDFDKEITVEKAARLVGYEPNSFCRLFKQATDTSFHQYLSNFRIKKACILLEESVKTISEIAELVGFRELKSFCRVFKQIKGVTPTEYRANREM